MSTDIIILVSAWAAMIVLLLVFVPKDKIRHACVIFFFKQFLTWLIGLTVAELSLIQYPVRSFSYAARSSFDFEYFIYPGICVIFNLNFPKSKSFLKRFMHYFYYCTVMTIIEAVVERYTNLIEYIHWAWYTTWITLLITFFASRLFYIWFFKLKEK